jgi:tetratricopeptide (TPR) repeat protein
MPSKKQRRAAAPVRGTISPDPSAGDPPSKSRRRTVAVSAGLICAVLAVYGQTAWFEFVSHDDPQHVYENEHVATGLSLENLAWAFGMVGPSQWHPLTWISHQIDCELYGLSSRGPHLTNVALHAGSAVLLFLLLQSLTGRCWPAALAAALFALHPVNVESVAWIAERKNVLSMFLTLCTLFAYAAYARRGGSLRYLALAVLLAAAMMAKPMLVTTPLLLLLLDFWPLQRLSLSRDQSQPGLRWLIVEKVPLQALAAGLALMTVLRHRATAAAYLAENPTYTPPDPVPALGRLVDSFVSYVTYLRMMVWPADLSVILPDRPSDYYRTLFWPAAGSIALLAGATAVVVLARRRPYLVFGWFWFLLAFVPVIGILPVGAQSLADRYAYLPFIGPFVALAWVAGEIARNHRRRVAAACCAAAAALAALGVAAHAQASHWRDSVALFTHAIVVTGGERLAHYNLGVALHQRGRPEAAIEQYRAALELNSRDPRAHHNLAYVLSGLGRAQEALEHYREAIRHDPALALAHSNLGALLTSLQQYEQAAPHLVEAVRLAPRDPSPRVHLAVLCRRLDRHDEAVEHLRDALDVHPRYAPAHTNLGIVYHDLASYERAIHHFERAIEIDPRHAEAFSNLGVTLHTLGRSSDALRALEEAARLSPSDAKVHVRLGTLFGEMHELERSIEHLGRAAALLPDDAALQFNLALALARNGDFAAAEPHARRAVELRPDGAAAYNLLGSILASRGKAAPAAEQYRKALELRPNWPEAMRNLARLIATCDDPRVRDGAEAVRLAQVLHQEADGRDPAALEILAAGYAAEGRFDEARYAVEQASELTRRAGDVNYAVHLERMAEQFRHGRPIRQSVHQTAP